MKLIETTSKRVRNWTPPLLMALILLVCAGQEAFSAAIEIIEQPKELLECEGAKDLKLRVLAKLAEGVTAQYQWYKDGNPISGAVKSSYKIPEMNSTHNGVYRCRIWTTTESVYTRDVAVYTLGKTSIVSQDTMVIVPFGKGASMNVEAHIKGYTAPFFQQGYQWWRHVEGKPDEKVEDNEQYSGSKTPRLNITRVDGDEFYVDNEGYYLEVDGQCGKVVSDIIYIRPNYGIKIIKEIPLSHEECAWPAKVGNYLDYFLLFKPIGIYDSIQVFHVVDMLNMDSSGMWGDSVYQFMSPDSTGRLVSLTYERVQAFNNKVEIYYPSNRFDYALNSKHNQRHRTRVKFFPSGEVFETPWHTWIFHDMQEITEQPQSQDAYEGEEFTLSVDAKCEFPLTYQWFHNGDILRGQTGKTLTIKNASSLDEGNYWVEVISKCGTIRSDTAVIKVIPRPSLVINKQPESITACEGATDLKLKIGVQADAGAVAHFQWYKDGEAIAGETTSTLKLGPISPAVLGKYKCRVWDPATFPKGSFSREVEVKAYGKVVITKQDKLVETSYGGSALLHVESEIQGLADPSAKLKYRWYRRVYGIPDEMIVDGKQYSGTTTPTLRIKSVDGLECYVENYGYYLRIEGHCAAVNSKIINVRPKIAAFFKYDTDGYQNVNAKEKCYNQILEHHALTWFADILVFGQFDSAKVEYLNNFPEVWGDTDVVYKRRKISYKEFQDGGMKLLIWGSDPFDYDDTLIKPNHPYIRKTRITFYPGGEVFESKTDTTIYYIYQEIERQPESAEIEEGADHMLSVQDKQPGLTVTYQWFKDGVEIEGATESTYTIWKAKLEDAGKYWVRLTSKCGPLGSAIAFITVRPRGIMTATDPLRAACALTVSPNPATDYLDIKFNAGDKNSARFRILEPTGREALSFTAEPGVRNISKDISQLSSGTYFIVMESGGSRTVEKFVVVK